MVAGLHAARVRTAVGGETRRAINPLLPFPSRKVQRHAHGALATHGKLGDMAHMATVKTFDDCRPTVLHRQYFYCGTVDMAQSRYRLYVHVTGRGGKLIPWTLGPAWP